MSSLNLLLITAAGIALLHTLIGADHYLPFAAMSRAFRWSRAKTLSVTLACGLGHVLSSAVLGMVGVALGWGLATLRAIETFRSQIAAFALVAFGLVYFVWGVRRALRSQPHEHLHVHADGIAHVHSHLHEGGHLHPHGADLGGNRKSVAPWMLFSIFLLGPCEPLIPLLMYPAVQKNWGGVALVTAVFGVVTLATMLVAVLACGSGMERLRLGHLERYAHAAAGAAISLCGIAIQVLHI